MPTETGGYATRTLLAGGTITQYDTLKMTDAETVARSTASTDIIIGIAMEAASSGEYLPVALLAPTVKMRAAGAITAPTWVKGSTGGEVTTATDGSYVLGLAMTDAGAADGIMEVLLLAFQSEDVSDHGG